MVFKIGLRPSSAELTRVRGARPTPHGCRARARQPRMRLVSSTDATMVATTADADAQLGRATLAKVGWRLLPFLLLLYIVAWIDRVNISVAALQMKPDLGLSDTVFGLGAGI